MVTYLTGIVPILTATSFSLLVAPVETNFMGVAVKIAYLPQGIWHFRQHFSCESRLSKQYWHWTDHHQPLLVFKTVQASALSVLSMISWNESYPVNQAALFLHLQARR